MPRFLLYTIIFIVEIGVFVAGACEITGGDEPVSYLLQSASSDEVIEAVVGGTITCLVFTIIGSFLAYKTRNVSIHQEQ